MSSEINLYWWNKKNNFGDIINPLLVSKISTKKVNRVGLGYKAPFYMCIGSIINQANSNSIIWGSGLICKTKMYKSVPNKIHAVRGPLTYDLIKKAGGKCPEIFGDPALLLPRYFNFNVEKKFEFGILPHYIDQNHEWIRSMKKMGYNIIDITNPDPLECLKKILECKIIVTSSLHGLIVADAYKIPNCWINLTGKLMGGRFKFEDYFESVRVPRHCVDLSANFSGKGLKYISKYVVDKEISIDLDALLDTCPFVKE